MTAVRFGNCDVQILVTWFREKSGRHENAVDFTRFFEPHALLAVSAR
jgi:hypothetical protein|tara:strand:- start:391 stop:531 length:141 start_codon:yes stop_codon:yes gene_type:complete